MNDKLSLQDLADILSQQTQISKKEAELFFKEFFQLILDRIYENDLVKVKDFGTFKLTAINSRESVDVNTGEKIEIPAHYRFTFLPDKALKELVNEPFSKYQTVLLEDGMDPSTVNFELQTNIAEDTDTIDDNEVSKVIQEQVKLVNELRAKPSENKTEPVKSTIRGSKIELIEKIPETLSKKEDESYRFTQRPFVYTYSNSKIDENKKDEDVIFMTVPRRGRIPKIGEDSIISDISESAATRSDNVSSPKIKDKKQVKETYEKVKKAEPHSAKRLEHSTADDFSVDIETTIFSISDVVSSKQKSTLEKKQGLSDIKDDVKSDLIETLPISKSIELDSSLKEDIPILNRNTAIVSKEKRSPNNIQSYRSYNNPDRPLIPEEADDKNQQQSSLSARTTSSADDKVEEIDIDTSFINDNGSSLGVTSKYDRDTLVDIDKSKNLFAEDTEVRDVENDPFFNFESQSAKRAKLKKIIPSAILILIVLVLVIYGLFKLFDVKYDYERYQGLGTSNLTMADTLPYLYEKEDPLLLIEKDSSIVQDYADSLSETNTVVVDTEISTSKLNPTSIKNINGSLLIDGSGKNAEQAMTKDSIYTRKRNVSNNLSINVVNKAQYFLHKKNEIKESKSSVQSLVGSQGDISESERSLKPRDKRSDNSVRLEQGMTLRSISSRYYGNANYWIYIYMANKEKLPNPDAMMIGLELSIPALNQYGVIDPKDPREIERAQRLETDMFG